VLPDRVDLLAHLDRWAWMVSMENGVQLEFRVRLVFRELQVMPV
jgi:hypothetical protein